MLESAFQVLVGSVHPTSKSFVDNGARAETMKRFLLFSLSFIAFALLLLDLEGLAAVFKTTRRLSGFSPDSRYYIYVESSRNSVTEVPTAQIQIIDVETNSCVKKGCLKTDYDNSSSNLSNNAAEDDLLKRTSELRRDLKLTQLKVGIPLPIISRSTRLLRLPPRTPEFSSSGPGGVEPIRLDRSETVEVRVNNQTDPLEIRLEQKYIPSTFSRRGFGDVERASMRLVINYNFRKLSLGDLNNYREAVKEYSIREVRLSPDGRNVAVLIDMTQPTYEGVLQTTFVQAFPLPTEATRQGANTNDRNFPMSETEGEGVRGRF